MRTCPKCERTYPDSLEVCPLDKSHLPAPVKVPDAELAGTLTLRYRIVRRLGEGGMGTVFLAEQLAVGNRPVALKVLLRKLLDDPEFILRFRAEAASTGRIRHPNVVTIYESGQAEDGTPYIAMEYLEGETLSQALQTRGSLPLEECVDILQQTARGLHAAHKLGIIHRDLKPDNIFLTRGDEGGFVVKVVDFGIAKLLDSPSYTTLTGLVLGTPAYMSAEQAAGMRGDELDPRSDVYSLGVVAYEMLTGRVPFPSDTPLGYLRKHMLEPPPALVTVRADLRLPPQVEKVTLKALEKIREKRFSTTLEFARDFAEAARPSPPAQSPAQITQPQAAPAAAPGSGRPPAPPAAPPPSSKPAPPVPEPARPVKIPGPAASSAPVSPALPKAPHQAPTPTPSTSKPSPRPPALPRLGALVIAAGLVLVAIAASLWFYSAKPPAGMVYISGGTFRMGSDRDPTASPPHSVQVAPFYLDQKPVTNAEYAEFVRATGNTAPSGWAGASVPPGQETRPVTGVSWAGAEAYAKWKGKRLPTEAEWEFAARGNDGRLYPWGSNFNPALTNSAERGLGHPEPVGSHPLAASPFGVLDMSGNVWQWCEDAYKSYAGNQMKIDIPADARVIRGGSFDSDRDHITTTTRNLDLATSQSNKIGFRCAKSL